jgi:hypothetical protein
MPSFNQQTKNTQGALQVQWMIQVLGPHGGPYDVRPMIPLMATRQLIDLEPGKPVQVAWPW